MTLRNEEIELDEQATDRLRSQGRPAAKLFHNGQYVDAME